MAADKSVNTRKSFYCVGFFGCPNFGDELLCYSVSRRLDETFPDNQQFIFTNNARVSRHYLSLDKVFIEGFYPSPEYYRHFADHITAVRNCDLIIIGGGGLISDKYSAHALWRYLIEATLGIVFNRKYVFVGIGVLPLKRLLWRVFAKFILNNAAFITCRDPLSKQRLTDLGVTNSIDIGPDLAFLCPMEQSFANNQTYGVLNLRREPGLAQAEIQGIAEEMLKYTQQIRFLCAENDDHAYYDSVIENFPPALQQASTIHNPENLREAFKVICEATFVVATRLHVCLVALTVARPLYAICYEDKVTELVTSVRANCVFTDYANVSANKLDTLMNSNRSAAMVVDPLPHVECKQKFDIAIDQGLTRLGHSIPTRVLAGVLFLLLLGYGLFYTIGVIAKRTLFGRGPISQKRSKHATEI